MAVPPRNTNTFYEFKRDVLFKIIAWSFNSYFHLFVVAIEEIGKTDMFQSCLIINTVNNSIGSRRFIIVKIIILEFKSVSDIKVKIH